MVIEEGRAGVKQPVAVAAGPEKETEYVVLVNVRGDAFEKTLW